MNYGGIIRADIANGVGIRLSLFVSGCENHCPGCFQPETWNFEYGNPFTKQTEQEVMDELRKPFYDGLTLLGGDPMELANQIALLPILERIQEKLPKKTVWAYTGYLYDRDLVPDGKRYIPGVTDCIFDMIDVLVDGPFILEKKNISLRFKGSENQRIIDVKKTRESGNLTIWNG